MSVETFTPIGADIAVIRRRFLERIEEREGRKDVGVHFLSTDLVLRYWHFMSTGDCNRPRTDVALLILN